MKDKKSYFLITVMLLVASSGALTSVALIPALAKISESQEFSHLANIQELVGWILGITGLFVAIGAPLVGLLSERLKKTHILLASMLLFAVAGSAGFYLDDIYLILVSRAFVGLAVAGIMTMNNTLIGDYFTGESRYRVMGLANGIGLGINILYAILAGILLDISWRYNFLLFLLGLVLIVPIFLAYPEPKSVAKTKEDNSKLEKKGNVFFILVTVLVAQCMFYMPFVQLSFIFEKFNSNGSQIALALNIFLVTAALGSAMYSFIRSKFHFKSIYALIFVGMGSCCVILGMANSYNMALVAMFIGGFFFGWLSPNSSLWIMQLVPLAQRARYIGFLASFWYMAVFLSPITFNLLNQHKNNVHDTIALVGMTSILLGVLFISYSVFSKVQNRKSLN